MAVPRNRLSTSRRNLRRAHHGRKPKHLIRCNNCGAAALPHAACPTCGVYRDRQVVRVAEGEE